MASGKGGGRTPHEAGAGQGKRQKVRRAVGKDAGQGRGAAVVDFDLWGAFFGELWEQGAGGEGADERPGGGKAGKGARTTTTKSGR
jgi:hypothetical protein